MRFAVPHPHPGPSASDLGVPQQRNDPATEQLIAVPQPFGRASTPEIGKEMARASGAALGDDLTSDAFRRSRYELLLAHREIVAGTRRIRKRMLRHPRVMRKDSPQGCRRGAR